jgi:hypothetical protein
MTLGQKTTDMLYGFNTHQCIYLHSSTNTSALWSDTPTNLNNASCTNTKAGHTGQLLCTKLHLTAEQVQVHIKIDTAGKLVTYATPTEDNNTKFATTDPIDKSQHITNV